MSKEQFINRSGHPTRRHDNDAAERRGHGPRQVIPYSRKEAAVKIDSDDASGTIFFIDPVKVEEADDRALEIKIAILDHGAPETLVELL